MENVEQKKNMFDRIYDDIRKQRDNGNIIVPTSEGPLMYNLDDFIKQPAGGMLYDLGLDEAAMATVYAEEPLKFAEMMAINITIKKLKSKLNEYSNGNSE